MPNSGIPINPVYVRGWQVGSEVTAYYLTEEGFDVRLVNSARLQEGQN